MFNTNCIDEREMHKINYDYFIYILTLCFLNRLSI